MDNEHELRRSVVNEMHLRRWPVLRPDCTVIQVLRLVDDAGREAEAAALADLPDGAALQPTPNPRHLQVRLSDRLSFGWERHSEASACTLFLDRPDGAAPDRAGDGDLAAALDWVMAFPGKVMRATRIVIVSDEAAAAAILPALAFEANDLVSCHVGAGARIWSDFRLREDGFGAVLVAANGMPPGDLSRTVQRLQELGNYRNLALLGLPVAQRGWQVLDGIERALARLAEQVASAEVTDDALLHEVTGLSMNLMTEAAASDFRLSATEAYATLVEERLAELAIAPITGYQSLADFTQRRFLPAIRTCAAQRRRQETLAQRTAQFISLFRTRIETRIENQNGRLLHSMEKSMGTQLRLQQLVEGLSVVALSYYGIGLLSYMLKGLEKTALHVPATIVVAVMTPFVVVLMWWLIHRLRARILHD